MEHIAVFSSAMLPFRGIWESIPVGEGVGLSMGETFFVAFLGSMLPMPFLMVLLKEALGRFGQIQSHENLQLEAMHIDITRNREILVLVIAAIPFFTANVWIASTVAVLMKISMREAVLIIAFGNIFSGFIAIILMWPVIA